MAINSTNINKTNNHLSSCKLSFCIQCAKMRNDCLFCWYWWNWWPWLFTLSFLCSVSKDDRWLFVLLILVELMNQYQQNKQSPLILSHWTQKESLNSNGHQFHQYQQSKQSPLILTHWTQKRKLKQSMVTLRWEMIVCFVDIGGIDDHDCLNFPFCVQWVKMKSDCLFCWYWWNWWPLLFKLSTNNYSSP
jgi:hypothetical protein